MQAEWQFKWRTIGQKSLLKKTLLTINVDLAEKKILLDDDISEIDLNQADYKKVAAMIQNNVLCIHKVGIYSLRMDQESFAFVYTRSPEESIQCYTESFQKKPLNCHEYSLDFELVKGKFTISFRNMKKEIESFPAIAGVFVRG